MAEEAKWYVAHTYSGYENKVKAKPSAAKGQYLRSIAVASTMGPGIKVNQAKF